MAIYPNDDPQSSHSLQYLQADANQQKKQKQKKTTTNSSSFKNQTGCPLSNFFTTPLSISLSVSLLLHHGAASLQMIGPTETCER